MRTSEANRSSITAPRRRHAAHGPALADRPRHRAGLRGHDRLLRRSRADDPAVVRQGIAPLADGRQVRIPEAEAGVPSASWAWGLSQLRQAAERIPGIDAGRSIAIGHSRLGKAALWAGVQDEGFAMVVSNDSGCAGAALSRRIYGETIGRIATSFPALVLPQVIVLRRARVGNADDQHQLLAAGRAARAARRQCDRGPLGGSGGEFLATQAADEVWRLHGVRGLGVTEMPPGRQTGGRAGALPHPHRWPRHHPLRLGAVPGHSEESNAVTAEQLNGWPAPAPLGQRAATSVDADERRNAA